MGSIRKGLLVAAGVLIADLAISELLSLMGIPPIHVLGDLLLLEVAVLAILGGVVEFSGSIGAYEFRQLLFRAKEELPTTRHKDASKKALVPFCAALALFLVLAVLTLWE